MLLLARKYWLCVQCGAGVRSRISFRFLDGFGPYTLLSYG